MTFDATRANLLILRNDISLLIQYSDDNNTVAGAALITAMDSLWSSLKTTYSSAGSNYQNPTTGLP